MSRFGVLTSADLADHDDIHRERVRSPRSRQLCLGANTQLMIDAEDTVTCPRCLTEFTEFTTQKNRDRVHPIVPSHLPDQAGALQVASDELRHRRNSDTPRPF